MEDSTERDKLESFIDIYKDNLTLNNTEESRVIEKSFYGKRIRYSNSIPIPLSK